MLLIKDFNEVKTKVYQSLNLYTSQPSEEEGAEYGAGNFLLEQTHIKTRSSKITPTKIGQFVTLWRRNNQNITEPFNISDPIDFVCINSRMGDYFGQFVFPISVLEKHGIISSSKSKGKRGFRVYPPWDKPLSNQAVKTQKWQLGYFLEISSKIDLEHAKKLYQID